MPSQDSKHEGSRVTAMPDYSGLKAILFNTTLKREENRSHTGALLGVSEIIMKKAGVETELVHVLSHKVPPGIYPDMREHGWEEDHWPKLWQRVSEADILVLGTPIWLGEESSVCRTIIERLYAMSGQLNDRGQSIFYGKCGGAVVTGNEDGIKHCSMSLLYALQHLGCVIPPQADCGWIGEAGPGLSYGDEREGDMPAGFDNQFTKQNTTIMTWNLMHMAWQLKHAGGLPTYGNDRQAWKDGERFGHQNPDASR